MVKQQELKKSVVNKSLLTNKELYENRVLFCLNSSRDMKVSLSINKPNSSSMSIGCNV